MNILSLIRNTLILGTVSLVMVIPNTQLAATSTETYGLTFPKKLRTAHYVVAKWDEVVTATSYDLTILENDGTVYAEYTDITRNKKRLKSLYQDTPYQVRLRVHYASGIVSDWSELVSFQTNPQTDPHDDERTWLPQISRVQKWYQLGIISERENFAPSIVQTTDQQYRMYWNSSKGIKSAISDDAINFTAEDGLRLKGKSNPKSKEYKVSHPWVIPIDDGYRMYYQSSRRCATAPCDLAYRIMSAFSEDGLNFTREGVRIDVGETTGLSKAAHGRVLQLADETYRMYFSANRLTDTSTADILGASSSDSLTWTLDQNVTLDQGHDPTVIQSGNSINIYTTYLSDNLLLLKSKDGYDFTPNSWIEFYDSTGQRIEEFGDIDIIQTADDQLLIYGSGKGSVGIGVFQRGQAED